MTTTHTDPARMHQLHRTEGGPLDPEHWHQFHFFATPFNMEKDEEARIAQGELALWRIVVGSDLILQCEYVTANRRDQVFVRAYDGSGNDLAILGVFGGGGTAGIRAPEQQALQALPSLTQVAHMLYPNHLLMPLRAEHSEHEPEWASVGRMTASDAERELGGNF